jgi:tetratricopeptide (TPR) repeat protein
MTTRNWLALALAALFVPASVLAQADPSLDLARAKALFFDRDYARAREAWQSVAASGGRDAEAARYWVARCSEGLGENARALAEYDQFLASRPSDRTYVEEAKTSRIALAVKMAKSGEPQRAAIAREALSDPSRTVRYFAALQLASLGPDAGRKAVPVLQEIIERERDDDLVERAKLALLRVDRDALARATGARSHRTEPPPRSGREARWVRVRIYEKGSPHPQVAINLPVALAELVFKSLPEDAVADLRKEGYDAASFWQKLKKLGPTEILTIEGDGGERIQVWLE